MNTLSHPQLLASTIFICRAAQSRVPLARPARLLPSRGLPSALAVRPASGRYTSRQAFLVLFCIDSIDLTISFTTAPKFSHVNTHSAPSPQSHIHTYTHAERLRSVHLPSLPRYDLHGRGRGARLYPLCARYGRCGYGQVGLQTVRAGLVRKPGGRQDLLAVRRRIIHVAQARVVTRVDTELQLFRITPIIIHFFVRIEFRQYEHHDKF